MTRLAYHGCPVDLSYSSNVHPAESLEDLTSVLREFVAPISRTAFGDGPASVNLRLGLRQADALLGHPALAAGQDGLEGLLRSAPVPSLRSLQETLQELRLQVASLNAFPVRDFHAPRVKEQVYEPAWTSPERTRCTLKIAWVLSQLVGDRAGSSLSVPSGCFKGAGDDSRSKQACAAQLIELVHGLQRLEAATGKTIVAGLEPEPFTTAETLEELLEYYRVFLLPEARRSLAPRLGLSPALAEELALRFLCVNLDLCHQAVEFEDPVEDLRLLRGAGIRLCGLHVSAALRLSDPGRNREALAQLLALDEPRYLHQVVARARQGGLLRWPDLPEFGAAVGPGGRPLDELAEVRCHFHVPLFAAFPGPLFSTRETVGPAVRFAVEQGLTDNLVVETYTWSVLNALARSGNPAAQAILGGSGCDVRMGLVQELRWARDLLQD